MNNADSEFVMRVKKISVLKQMLLNDSLVQITCNARKRVTGPTEVQVFITVADVRIAVAYRVFIFCSSSFDSFLKR